MPAYPWLFDDNYDQKGIAGKIKAMQTLGVPYEEGYAEVAVNDMNAQAQKIAKNLDEASIEVSSDREIIALIAYLQRMGTDIKGEQTALK
jgi:cytochrome c oxidase cbb3-type subunit I/II